MGWAFCGRNRQTGEEMGYGVVDVCAEPGCNVVIDHGLAHVCGDMHEDAETCQRYYCEEHLSHSDVYNIGPGAGSANAAWRGWRRNMGRNRRGVAKALRQARQGAYTDSITTLQGVLDHWDDPEDDEDTVPSGLDIDEEALTTRHVRPAPIGPVIPHFAFYEDDGAPFFGIADCWDMDTDFKQKLEADVQALWASWGTVPEARDMIAQRLRKGVLDGKVRRVG